MKGWNLVNSRNIMSEINITPLTDVMLVLLVIFMVTTPLLIIESFKIKLPRAVSADAEAGKGITISITRDGTIYLNNKALGMEMLYGSIKAELAATQDKTVIVKADRDISHGMFVNVLDTAKRAGAEKLSVATEPERQPKDR